MKTVLLIFILSASALFSRPLRYGFIHFPPYQYADQNSTPDHRGLYIEFLEMVFKDAGIEYELVPTSHYRLVKDFTDTRNTLDIILTTTDIRDQIKDVVIAGSPIFSFTVSLYQNLDSTKEIAHIKDIKNQTIIIPPDNREFFMSIAPPDNTPMIAMTSDAVPKTFIAQRAFFLIDLDIRTDVALAHTKSLPFQVKKHPLINWDFLFVIRKNIPKAPKIMDKINRSFYKLKKPSILIPLYEKYGVPYDITRTIEE